VSDVVNEEAEQGDLLCFEFNIYDSTDETGSICTPQISPVTAPHKGPGLMLQEDDHVVTLRYRVRHDSEMEQRAQHLHAQLWGVLGAEIRDNEELRGRLENVGIEVSLEDPRGV